MLFGNGRFDDIFGDVAMADMMSMGEMTEEEQNDVEKMKKREEEYTQKQEERKKKLVDALLNKINPFVCGNKVEFQEKAKTEAEFLVETPGGDELLHLVGYVYVQEAKQHLGGITGYISQIQETYHILKQGMSVLKSAVITKAAQDRIEEKGEDSEMVALLMQEGFNCVWKMGKLEIDSMLRMVCEATLSEPKSNKKERKKRCDAVKLLGQTYKKVAKQASKDILAEMKKQANSQKSSSTSSTTPTTPANQETD